MSAGAEGDREDRALEALIVSAFCRDDRVEEQGETCDLPPLSEEKERALNELSKDFVKRVVNGLLCQPRTDASADKESQGELAMAGESACFGLDRAEEIDEETQAELDERRRRIRERKRGEEEGNGETGGE